MARVAVHFLIPKLEDRSLGEGRAHPPSRFQCLQRELEQAFGGWTILNREVQGVWIDPKGTRIQDDSVEYVVDVEEERLEEMRGFLAKVATDFFQQCLRVVIRGEVEYIEGAGDDEEL